MENIEKSRSSLLVWHAPWWYTAIVILWGPVSLVVGVGAAFGMMAPAYTLIVAALVDVVQVLLLGVLMDRGLRYFSAKQLSRRFLFAFLLMVIVPVVWIVVDTPGEITVGALMFMVFLSVTLPQIVFAILYGIMRRIFPLSPYRTLFVCAAIHVVLFVLAVKYLLDM